MHGYAGFPVGAFALASALDVEVLSIFVLKSSYRKYIVYVKPIRIEGCCARDRQGVTEEYVRAFAGEMERILRLYPLQWFNYYDFFDEEG
jgi:predicted LPLAT superfamily acyltransferase